MLRTPKLAALAALTVMTVTPGCSSDGANPLAALPPLTQPTSTPATPQPPPALTSVNTLLPKGTAVVGSPTEVYTRIARGVLTCWFGAAGPLKTTHAYQADAQPASKGGDAKIEIFEKDPTAPDPRALRAFRIEIKTVEGTTRVETENVKLPEPLATRFQSDVDRWKADEGGCGDAAVTEGWTAAPVQSDPHATMAAQSKKKKL